MQCLIINECHLIVRFQRSAAFEVGFRGLTIVECELRLAAPEPRLGRLRVLLDRLVSEEFDYGLYALCLPYNSNVMCKMFNDDCKKHLLSTKHVFKLVAST